MSATLTDANGTPVSQRPVRFTLGPTSVVAYTGSNGVAATSVLLTAPPGNYQLVASFPGDGGLQQASSAPAAFSILRMPTSVTLAADPPAVESPPGTWHASSIFGDPTTVFATVANENGAPVTERSVLFVAYHSTQPIGALVARTNWRGRANLGALPISPGSYTVRAYFGQRVDLGGTLGVFDLRDQGYDASTSADANVVILDIASTLKLSTNAAVTSPSAATYTAAGQTVTYTYALENTGNVTLAGPFTVTATRASTTCNAVSLAPGDKTQCSQTYTTTQADVDAGALANSATAYGSYAGAQVPSNVASASVSATQAVTFLLSGSAQPATYNTVGQSIALSFMLTNTGNVTLQSPSVANATCPSGVSSLTPGATLTCTVSAATVTQADLDSGSISVQRSGSASFGGTALSSQSATATATAVQTKSLAIVTYSATPTTFSAAGQPIAYTYTIKNTGNTSLAAPFAVADTRVSVSCTGVPVAPAKLAPGATFSCTGQYTSTSADVLAGGITSTASATAESGVVAAAPKTATVPYTGVRFPTTVLTKNNYIWFNAVGTLVGRQVGQAATLSFTKATIKLTLSAARRCPSPCRTRSSPTRRRRPSPRRPSTRAGGGS